MIEDLSYLIAIEELRSLYSQPVRTGASEISRRGSTRTRGTIATERVIR